jgi:hypothetical protein
MIPSEAKVTSKPVGIDVYILVRGVGPPPYFTGKKILRLCLAKVRISSGTSYGTRSLFTIKLQIGNILVRESENAKPFLCFH